MAEGPSILVVDDDEDFRFTTESVLRKAGYAVLAVPGYGPALKVLESTQPLGLLITDIMMPDGIHGIALGRMALMRRPKLKIIYLTGFHPGDALREASGPILIKPVAPEQLLAEVARQLNCVAQTA